MINFLCITACFIWMFLVKSPVEQTILFCTMCILLNLKDHHV